MYLFSVLLLYFELWYIYTRLQLTTLIYIYILDYTCLHCWFYTWLHLCTFYTCVHIYILDYSWLHLFTLLILQLQQLFDKPVHRSPILSGSRSSSVLDLTHSMHEIRPLRFGWSADALWPDQLYSYVYTGSDSLTLGSLASPKPYRPTGWHRLR
jgi:hypothetical protein